MQRGLTLPIFDQLADPNVLANLAVDAEQAGWEGFFLWDHVRYRAPVQAATDPWIALAAVAARTQRIRLGPMVTPLARRRPQIVARQIVALDHLSHGRSVLGVGLGLDASGEEFLRFGEETDLRTRATMFDESLELLAGLLSGRQVDHHGAHYTATDVQFLPTPVHGRLPIWVAARWPNRSPLRRAARYDGVFVIDLEPAQLPEVVSAMGAEVGGDSSFAVVVHDRPHADPAPWADAGATWLLTTFDAFPSELEEVRRVITQGPRH